MEDQEITWELVQQLCDHELRELLEEEADMELSLEQVSAIRHFIRIAGDLDAALELVEAVKDMKKTA